MKRQLVIWKSTAQDPKVVTRTIDLEEGEHVEMHTIHELHDGQEMKA